MLPPITEVMKYVYKMNPVGGLLLARAIGHLEQHGLSACTGLSDQLYWSLPWATY